MAYDSAVKVDLLGVPAGPVVSAGAAEAMAAGARRVLNADIGISVTGVAGPSPQDGQPPGTVFMAVAAGAGATVESVHSHLPGDRTHVRMYATVSLLDLLRRRLLSD